MEKMIIYAGLLISSLMAEVNTLDPLSKISIEGDRGGYFNGKAWHSTMIEDKTTMLMYVDPDEKDKGDEFKSTIEAFEKDLDFNHFQILVVLNLKATWKPNALIETLLKDKSKKYPKRIYILDKDSVLVKEWKLRDNEYNTLVIDKSSKVLYSHSGKWKEDEISQIDTLIRSQFKHTKVK